MSWHEPTICEKLKDLAQRLREAEREEDLDELHDLVSDVAWDIDDIADKIESWRPFKEDG